MLEAEWLSSWVVVELAHMYQGERMAATALPAKSKSPGPPQASLQAGAQDHRVEEVQVRQVVAASSPAVPPATISKGRNVSLAPAPALVPALV